MSLLLFSFLSLCADTQLKQNYFINSKTIKLSDIINKSSADITLYTISQDRHSIRVKSRDLVQKLNRFGYKDISTTHNYIQFTLKSPIDVSKMVLKVKEYFMHNYHDISIDDVFVYPRSYLLALPQEYEIFIDKKSYLKSKGTLHIKTQENKKIFFKYKIKAKIDVLVAKETINRGQELSILNLKKKSIMLNKFRAMPLQKIEKSSMQAKHRIKKGTILTSRDTSTLVLVKRGSTVSVTVRDATISISFSAKANQDGRYGQSISATNSSGKKLKVVVTGRNTAEIR